MKTIFLALTLLTSFSIFAKTLTLNEQEVEIEKISKSIRRSQYIDGYTNVSSSFELVSSVFLEEYIAINSDFYQPLEGDQIDELYVCQNQELCNLYLVYVSSDFNGGSGVKSYFIMLDIQTAKYTETSHFSSGD
jgi:hypothetical protein